MLHEKFTEIFTKILAVLVITALGVGCYYRDSKGRETDTVQAKGYGTNQSHASVSSVRKGYGSTKSNPADYKWLNRGQGIMPGYSGFLFGSSLRATASNFKWPSLQGSKSASRGGGANQNRRGNNPKPTAKNSLNPKAPLHASAESVRKICMAISIAETGGCKPEHPGTKIFNCNGIMYWDKQGKRHLKPFDSIEDNTQACIDLWNDHYKGYPTLSKAIKWTGNDRAVTWLKNVTTYLNNS